jgi:chaperonin GroES
MVLQSAIKSIRSIAPLLDRILVQRIKPEAKTATGIFLPETAVKELNEAKVLAVGPGAIDKEGKRITPSVQPGDKVLIPQVRSIPAKDIIMDEWVRTHGIWQRANSITVRRQPHQGRRG